MAGKNRPHQALYLKYRSKTLAEVVGQGHITDVLSQAIKKHRLAHAYLLTGPRGVGKTSVARILAHQITGLEYSENNTHPDIIEIDAASNRRIDDIRDLRDKVQIAPIAAPYKVYIIDEVHMLTGESFNAFLKTLEEPPAHVVFILATTDAHRLPVTVTSRTQRFTFRSIPTSLAVAHLRKIANSEKILITDEALELLAEHGDGSFRDSISLLDQLSSLSDSKHEISAEMAENVLGLAGQTQISKLLTAYSANQSSEIITLLNKILESGVNASTIASQLIKQATAQLAQQPQFVPLLSQLIDVQASPRPDVKLLVALLPAQVEPRQKPNVILAEAATSPAAHDIKELVDKAKQPRPEASVNDNVRSAKLTQPVEAAQATAAHDFKWSNLLAAAQKSHVALFSILSRCQPEIADGRITLYTGTAFWKNKLDTSRYQQQLRELLAEHGGQGYSIEMIAKPLPPQDKTAAAVVAVMGGGIEVSLEEIG